MKRGKKYIEAAKLIERGNLYDPAEAVARVRSLSDFATNAKPFSMAERNSLSFRMRWSEGATTILAFGFNARI